jgi:hypothetical protein
MKNIFISFSSQDETLADDATRFMEKKGWSVWRCTRFEDNMPGGNWIKQLNDQLFDCAAVLLLYTVSAGKSKYVIREVAQAVDWGKPIVVVKLDAPFFSQEIAFLLKTLQVLDARGIETSAWLPKACKALEQFMEKKSLIPIDSIENRDLKVEIVNLLLDEHFHQKPVYIHGVAIHMKNMAHEFLKNPYTVSMIHNRIQDALSGMAILTEKDSEYCILPFLVKENVMLLVFMTTRQDPENKVENILGSVPAIIQKAIFPETIFPEEGQTGKMPELEKVHHLEIQITRIKRPQLCLAGNNNKNEIAHYLTNLGKDKKKGGEETEVLSFPVPVRDSKNKDETTTAKQAETKKIDPTQIEPKIDIKYQELLKKLITKQDMISFQLPRKLTSFTAKTHLETILNPEN